MTRLAWSLKLTWPKSIPPNSLRHEHGKSGRVGSIGTNMDITWRTPGKGISKTVEFWLPQGLCLLVWYEVSDVELLAHYKQEILLIWVCILVKYGVLCYSIYVFIPYVNTLLLLRAYNWTVIILAVWLLLSWQFRYSMYVHPCPNFHHLYTTSLSLYQHGTINFSKYKLHLPILLESILYWQYSWSIRFYLHALSWCQSRNMGQCCRLKKKWLRSFCI